MQSAGGIPEALRLVLVTDGRGDPGRLRELVPAAVAGGVTAVLLREPGLEARRLGELAEGLRPVLEAAGGLLLVHDRVDVAALHAHGGHVGHRSLPPEEARRLLAGGVLGYSAHDPEELRRAASAGCDYAFLSPVLPTASHPGAPPLGLERAARWTAAAGLPVVWLGGIDAAAAARIAALPEPGRPAGLAALGALCGSGDPEAAARALRY